MIQRIFTLTLFTSSLLAAEPEKLAQLRGSYESAISKAIAPIQQTYIKELEKLKIEFTKAGNLEAAIAVDAELKKNASLTAPLRLPMSNFVGSKPGEEKVLEIAVETSMTFCWIPPGDYLMGSPAGESGRAEDETRRRVTISKGFWMAETEVTQAQWQALMGRNPSSSKNGGDFPVETVTWNDVQKFIGLMNSNSMPPGWKASLPTEAQWEYACRAGETGPYSGGNLDEVGWHRSNSAGKASPVGMKKANSWGLHDMHGNVWEWCADWHGVYSRDDVRDPVGPSSSAYRVTRGGSRSFGVADCRAAHRGRYAPDLGSADLGFRPVLVPLR